MSSTVVIIGAGLVGSLCGTLMAKRGFQVILYEKRNDPRTEKLLQGRSINLAISHRGRKALRAINLEEVILRDAIPMKGRLIHTLNGNQKSILYDPKGKQCIYSVSRQFLNQILLDAIEKYSNVNLFFNHKFIDCNFKNGTITIQNLGTKENFEINGDLIVGADGAFSCLRRQMQKLPLFQFSQTYIEHGYMELNVPSKRGHLMVPNHLHIWPRGQFMMIALPNQDNSWTVTLFMPFEIFNSLTNRENLLEFFGNIFPDSIDLIGREELVDTFFKTKPNALVSIKCKPYQIDGRFLIIGDAAHAMVPFYGQGMNAGFEDCTILDDLLTKHQNHIGKTLKEFSDRRVDDAHSICDLAMYNYVEMRDLVQRKSYKIRKFFDDNLYKIFGDQWIPLYNSVTFSQMGYKECIENRNWQNCVIKYFNFLLFTTIIVLLLSVIVFYLFKV